MKERLKLTYVISGIDYSLGFLWLSQHLDNEKYDLTFVFLNKTEPTLYKVLIKAGIKSKYIQIKSKLDYFSTLLKLSFHFLKERPNIVHAHLFEAGLLSMLAAKITLINKRIYTRHHATYNSIYFPHMVKYDKFINRLSTQLVSISENVSKVLIETEKAAKKKVHLIPHGFIFDEFIQPDSFKVEKLIATYNPNRKRPVVGVISRFIELKGIQFIIPAFQQFLQKEPNALLVLANATGNYSSKIQELLNSLPKDSYIKIEFEKELFSLYRLFDYFIHVPIDPTVEAYGQVYIEALASGVPSIFTLSGIAHDFIENERNSLIVPYQNSQYIYQSLIRLKEDSSLKDKIIRQGREDIINKFSFTNSLNKLYLLYES
ncbi:MAG: glycosyltransferase family 4 protein [Bacteroidia bacterium]